jgi:LuxR family transcriptional regulator, maltose regulon positive regulatory protein
MNYWQSVLLADPLFETVYQNLMILHADAGQKHKALNMFEECKKALKTELDSEPDKIL